MAGVIVHLAVADATFKELNIKNLPLYYAGNVAPDCIHSRKNYQREMKKHTHLRDGISDWDFILPETRKQALLCCCHLPYSSKLQVSQSHQLPCTEHLLPRIHNFHKPSIFQCQV